MKKYFIIGMVVLTVVSCGKKYLNVNVNPNSATQTSASYIFTNGLASTARNQSGGLHITGGSWSGFYGHSTSFTGGGQEKTYSFTNSDFNFFDGMYDNLADYQYVIDHAVADGVTHLIGPAKIMQCYVYQKLVDIYGNVPYSQALKGASFPTPAYDDAKTIYDNLVIKLTEAIADINAATFPAVEPADIYFKGNKTMWKQFANTIKLRLFVRQSNVAGFNPTAAISAISADGYITSPVLSQPGYTKTTGKLNPYFGNWGFNENDAPTGDFRKMSSVVVNWLKNSADVFRLGRICSIIANPANDIAISNTFSDYAGVPLGGSGNAYLSSNVSGMGRMQIVKGDAARPVVVMSDAEASFLRAELIQRGWMAGSAQTAFENGVRLAFRIAAATYTASATASVAAADAAANSYLASATVHADWSVSTDKLKAIWVQKWVALCNIDGTEAWAEYRRTNSPTNPNGLLPLPASTYSAKSVAVSLAQAEPVRFLYPLREESVNGANVPKPISEFTSRIFWDIN